MQLIRHPLLRPLLALAAVGGLAWAAWGQRAALAAFDWSLPAGALIGAVALLAVAPVLQAVGWVVALRRLGAAAPAGPALRAWARSFVLRYEPSGALGYVHRVRQSERLGASPAAVLTASGYEQLAAVAAGAATAVGAALLAGLRPSWPALGLLGGLVALGIALRPGVLGDRVVAGLRARGIHATGPLPGRVLAGLVAVDAIGWLATGLGVTVLVRALGVGPEALGGAALLAAFALGWLFGVLVPLAPGGLGLRDATFVVAVGAAVGPGTAAALALALRLVSLAGELAAVAALEALAWGTARAARARARRAAAAAVVQGAAVVQAAAVREASRRGTIVVVPTYEEAATLRAFVERFAVTGLELLVVDDASPDGTGALADALAADGRPWLHVLHRPGKEGLGIAYRAGFAWCLARGYRVIGQMDADGSHPPEKLAEMLHVLDDRDADLVIANRYLPGGGTEGWSRSRRGLSRAGCAGSRLALRLPYTDLSGGFKLWRASCLAELHLDAMLSTGYAFQVETTLLAHVQDGRIEEVPFVFSERVAGASKMSLAVSLEGVRVTLALRRRLTGHRALADRCTLTSARARSSVDRALASGARGRRFESCRARLREGLTCGAGRPSAGAHRAGIHPAHLLVRGLRSADTRADGPGGVERPRRGSMRTRQPWLAGTGRSRVRLLAVTAAAILAGALAVLPATATATPPTTTLTFDELSPRPVDGVQIAGISSAFRVAGAPSTDATYGGFGPGVTTYVSDPSIEGTTAGTLILRFDHPTTVLGFGLALSTGSALTPGATIQLFNPGGHARGTSTLNTTPLSVFTEGRFSYRGGAIGSAVITFSPGADRFALDNLSFRALPPAPRAHAGAGRSGPAWSP